MTIHFGAWDINAGNLSTAWTELGTSVASTSAANAVRISITRETGKAFGPVTSLFARIFGISSSKVSAIATAYLGYTNEVQTGGVQVPLALPSTGPNNPLCVQRPRRLVCPSFRPQRGRGHHHQDLCFQGYRLVHCFFFFLLTSVPTNPVAALDPNHAC